MSGAVVTLIRNAIQAKVAHQIRSEDGNVFIPTSTGTKQFVATGKTTYKDRSSKEFVTVGSLYNMVNAGIHTGLSFADYKKNPTYKEKVGVLDWMELKRYLTGEIETSKQIMTGDATENEGSSGSVLAAGSRGRGGRSGQSGSGTSASGSAESNQLLIAAERSLKRKRELIEGCGMTEKQANECADNAKNQEIKQGSRTSILDVVQGDFTEILNTHRNVAKLSNKKSKKVDKLKPIRDAKYPIILVSASTSQAKLSMWNSVSFLGAERRYVTIKDAKAHGSGRNGASKEPKQLMLTRNNVKFRILPISVTSKKAAWSPNDYSRVVGLFTDGSTWCYKKWPSSNPVDVFNSTAGFHLYFADEKPHPNCQKWIVDKIAIMLYSSLRWHMQKVDIDQMQRFTNVGSH